MIGALKFQITLKVSGLDKKRIIKYNPFEDGNHSDKFQNLFML